MPLHRDKQAQVIRTGSERPGSISGWPTVTLGCTGDLITLGRWQTHERTGVVSCQQPTHRYKRGGHEHIAIPNYLERQFVVTEPNQVWRGYVTYIWTGKCRAYLAVVLDLFARKPVGLAMSFSPDSRLTIKALTGNGEGNAR